MAGSVNKAILVGRLGRDPEIRETQNGSTMATISVATSESWKDKNGEWQEKTEWHKVVCFNKLAEIAEKILTKGSLVYIEGKIETRKWQDQEGQDRYSTEIVLSGYNATLTRLQGSGDKAEEVGSGDSTGRTYAQRRQPPPGEDLDDEIPF